MAEIISMSLSSETLDELDAMQKLLGFSGRSETIRAGIKSLLSEKKELSQMKGKVDAVLLVIHADKHTQDVAEIRHKYPGIIKTQVHNHLENDKCLEIFVVSGTAEKIKALANDFRVNKKIDYSRVIVP